MKNIRETDTVTTVLLIEEKNGCSVFVANSQETASVILRQLVAEQWGEYLEEDVPDPLTESDIEYFFDRVWDLGFAIFTGLPIYATEKE